MVVWVLKDWWIIITALLAKWWWRLSREKDALRVEVVSKKYGLEFHSRLPQSSTNGIVSSVWKVAITKPNQLEQAQQNMLGHAITKTTQLLIYVSLRDKRMLQRCTELLRSTSTLNTRQYNLCFNTVRLSLLYRTNDQ
ncbi:hypothetical protein RHMOL_Rhmol04G0030900 [Rhododendron molle]|uniref:Uncharacterized protein n=1 Tax=Rhododendron molle TaxID=49168 RepID=A0ACC0NWW9_RHOML|nr:hypothetical protein RHMOL_Rhmol04G0030900 [Rhododendron molle]